MCVCVHLCCACVHLGVFVCVWCVHVCVCVVCSCLCLCLCVCVCVLPYFLVDELACRRHASRRKDMLPKCMNLHEVFSLAIMGGISFIASYRYMIKQVSLNKLSLVLKIDLQNTLTLQLN